MIGKEMDDDRTPTASSSLPEGSTSLAKRVKRTNFQSKTTNQVRKKVSVFHVTFNGIRYVYFRLIRKEEKNNLNCYNLCKYCF